MSNNIDNNPIATSDTEDCSIFSSSSMNKKSSGRPREEVWDDYNIDKKNGKYYYIQCKYCSTHWQRGIPANMELHLANECSSCPQYKQKYWQDKIVIIIKELIKQNVANQHIWLIQMIQSLLK